MNTSTNLSLSHTSIPSFFKQEEGVKLEPGVKREPGIKQESGIKREISDEKTQHNKRIRLASSEVMSELSGANSSSSSSSSSTHFSSSSSSSNLSPQHPSSYPQVTSALVQTGLLQQNQSSFSSFETHAASPCINRENAQQNSNIANSVGVDGSIIPNMLVEANSFARLADMEPYSCLHKLSFAGRIEEAENKLLNLFSPDDLETNKLLLNKPLSYINLLIRQNYKSEDTPKKQKLLVLHSFLTSHATENPSIFNFNKFCEYFQKIEELGLRYGCFGRYWDNTTLMDAYNISISTNNTRQQDIIKLATENTFMGINNVIFYFFTRNLHKTQPQLSTFIKLLEIYKYNFVNESSLTFEIMPRFKRHIAQLTKEEKYDELYDLLIQTFKSGLYRTTHSDTPNEVISTFFNARRFDLAENALEFKSSFLNRDVFRESLDILVIAEMLAACGKWEEVERVFSFPKFKVYANKDDYTSNRYLQLIIPSYTHQGKFEEAEKLLSQSKATPILKATLLVFVWVHEKKFSKAQDEIKNNFKIKQNINNKAILEFLEAVVSTHLKPPTIENFRNVSSLLTTVKGEVINNKIIIQIFRTNIIYLIKNNHSQLVEKELSNIIIHSYLSHPRKEELMKILTEIIEKRVRGSMQTSVASTSTSSSSSSLQIG